jgi:hypothetical protein
MSKTTRCTVYTANMKAIADRNYREFPKEMWSNDGFTCAFLSQV